MKFRLNQNEKLFVDLKSLSDFRTPLMGISIILVLLCHAKMDGANLPYYILRILNLGNWGVDIFFLLSGIGMYFSITKKIFKIRHGLIGIKGGFIEYLSRILYWKRPIGFGIV